ncbi:MAG: tyrosine--tRNA ligase [Candidatus Doudnabacteria bacterium]
MNKQELIKDVLERCVEEIVHKKSLEQKLKFGKKLRIKLGIDPTSPNIHIGRAVILWKLRAFQDLGHTAVFIIGDFTGQIGDTSDKDSERPMLSEEQVKENLQTYLKQAYKILDKSKTEYYYNSKWLKKLGFAEISSMANQFGLNEFSSRENIKKRLDAGKRVSLRELLYPLMQGFDSVKVEADVELGATDQRFNMLAGRTLQEFYKQKPQDILMTGLIEGTDGRKMSSSWGNTINITEDANEMFGKLMSINDQLINRYFEYTTRVPLAEIKSLLKTNPHPRDQKLILAFEVTKLYHGEKLAEQARQSFIAQFSNKELPEDIPQIKLPTKEHDLLELLVSQKLVTSKSEARRLVEQGGVKVNQNKFTQYKIDIVKNQSYILQVGKRKYLRIN